MGKIVVGILAHVDAGKTTLSEGMLYTAGAIRTMGRVDNRDAFLDTYALERERGITIFSKQAVFPLGTTQVTLLDTPGHVDFSPEMERTLQVLRLCDLSHQWSGWSAGTYQNTLESAADVMKSRLLYSSIRWIRRERMQRCFCRS